MNIQRTSFRHRKVEIPFVFKDNDGKRICLVSLSGGKLSPELCDNFCLFIYLP